MARYFFHLCDGKDVLLDPDGREIGNPSEIARIALREARVCISHDAIEGRVDLSQSIEVRDEGGELVCIQRFRDAVTITDAQSG